MAFPSKLTGKEKNICSLINIDKKNIDKLTNFSGYMSPEYASGGKISEKSDIYSFGVMLLEIISGKKANQLVSHNNQQLSLINYVSSFLINILQCFDIRD